MKKVTAMPCLFFLLLSFSSCKEKNKNPAPDALNAISLKRGELVVCGPANKEFGAVGFDASCPAAVKEDFNLAIALLHSFEYDEAEKVFATVIDAAPGCAMAYWGVAMSNYHPLWAPPAPPELEKGAKAIAIAQSLPQTSEREKAYIEAIATFYKNWNNTDHRSRSIAFAHAMEKLYTAYPDDKEAAAFYALSLTAAADPSDKTFRNQKKAGAILNALYPDQPAHPGIVHYIIHAYDNPELAKLGLEAARKYASVAPSSAHALHMPSHIFTRLGLWEECIQSNRASVASAKCYAAQAGIQGHWDEELHGLDYLVYAYLQRGENDSAKQQLNYLKTITQVSPTNFKVAYAFAAIPCRYMLENSLWKEAAAVKLYPASVPWESFPWQKAIVHFTRLMGAVHTGNSILANAELKELNRLHDKLVAEKDTYKAAQVSVQIKTGSAWMQFKEGKKNNAIQLMKAAADAEDKTEKHAVTPGEVLPARELLGNMLLQMQQPAAALKAYEAALKNAPNRFNSLYGAAVAAAAINNYEKAVYYYNQLTKIAAINTVRPELESAKQFLAKQRSI